jgi:branched-chain amino acid transport system permease protein
LPFFIGDYWTYVVIIGMYYAVIVASWDLLAGYTGQLSFGQLAFSAIGGYTSALLVQDYGITLFFGPLLGSIAAAGAGLFLGIICLRLKGIYLGLVTFGFEEIVRNLIAINYDVTGGEGGLRTSLFFATISQVPYYFLMLGILSLSVVVIYLLVNSRIGVFLKAIREDQEAAAALGVNTVNYKILAFVLSSFLTGLAGAFYAHYEGLLSPEMAVMTTMAVVVAMGVVGGTGSLFGPVVSAIVLESVVEYFRVLGEARYLVFGALLILTLRFMPGGMSDLPRILRRSLAPRINLSLTSPFTSPLSVEQALASALNGIDELGP